MFKQSSCIKYWNILTYFARQTHEQIRGIAQYVVLKQNDE